MGKNQPIEKVNLNSVFNMEPKEIVEYFEQKGLKTTYDWHELYADAHAKAFTVAKMTEIDLLNDTKKLLEKSLKEGQSYSQFKKEAESLFAKKGWTGKRIDVDSNGNAKVVELGTPRRIKKIYDCNMNSAYSVGRYKEMCEEIDVAPYWQYMCIVDGSTRPEHLAMHGKVFKADDSFWSSFFPPNGWGCRCFVRNLTKSEFKRKNLTVEETDGTFSTAKVKVGNEIKEVPTYKFNDGGIERILKPDAGWETNLGVKVWGLDIQAWNKVKDMPENIKYKFISEMASNKKDSKGIVNIIDDGIKNNFKLKQQPRDKVLTWFTPEIYRAVKNYSNEKLISPIAIFQERQVKHSLKPDVKVEKQRLTELQLKNIHKMVDEADEIFIDTEDLAVVYVKFLPKEEIIDGRNCIKIPFHINSKKDGYPLNYMATSGRINYENTFGGTQTRYKKVEQSDGLAFPSSQLQK